ncbi:hypothetical protein D1871_08575 [Nakamurella silvestris]|nr:hypothetical protein D1871_08575 [Nakamurella silvestris]
MTAGLLAVLIVGCTADTSRAVPDPRPDPTGSASAPPPGASNLPPTEFPRMALPTGPVPTDGPGPDARPMLWVTYGFGYFCATEGTLLADLVVYDDFSALRSENSGDSCSPLPTISTGTVDPQLVVDLIHDFQVADLRGFSAVRALISDAGPSYVSVDLGDNVVQFATSILSEEGPVATGEDLVKLDQLSRIRDRLRGAFRPTGSLAPARLVVEAGYTDETKKPKEKVPRWPGQAVTGCQSVPDDQVAQILREQGNRAADAPWKVAGRTQNLILGVVLPGFAPCAQPWHG